MQLCSNQFTLHIAGGANPSIFTAPTPGCTEAITAVAASNSAAGNAGPSGRAVLAVVTGGPGAGTCKVNARIEPQYEYGLAVGAGSAQS